MSEHIPTAPPIVPAEVAAGIAARHGDQAAQACCDLADLAMALRALDQGTPRGRNERWFRELRLVFGGRQPERLAAQRQRLETLLGFLSGDRVALEFRSSPGLGFPPARGWNLGTGPTVSLFSGGMDSLHGAVFHGEGALLLRASARGGKQARQVTAAAKTGPLALLPLPTIKARPKERSNRLRSFVFLALGTVACLARGSRRLLVHENGPMAFHCPASPARASSFSTRTAHPAVLRLWQALATELLGVGISVENPARGLTRREMAAQLIEAGQGGALSLSYSCQRPGAVWPEHCGECMPCLHRRIALELASGRPCEMRRDPFLAFPDTSPKATVNLLDLARFCRAWTSPEEGLAASPWLLASGLEAEEVGTALRVYRRFSDEFREYLWQFHPSKRAMLWDDAPPPSGQG